MLRSTWRVAGIVVCLVFSLGHQVQAQTTVCASPCVLNAGQTYAAVANHDGVNTDGYNVYQSGVKIATVTMSALSGGVVTVKPLTAPAKGSYSLQFGAYNVDTDGTINEALSDPYPFSTKKPAPGKPVSPRILVWIDSVSHLLNFAVVEE